MKTAPLYRRSGLAAEALHRALRQRIMQKRGYEPGNLDRSQKQDLRRRITSQKTKLQKTQPGLETLNPALRNQFLEQRKTLVQNRNAQQAQAPKSTTTTTTTTPGPDPAPVQPPSVKINANGQLDLPYDPAMSDDILNAKDQMNARLLQMQQQEQAQNLEYGQLTRNANMDFQNLARQTLNKFAGRGLAFSSGYGNQIAENSTEFSNYMNDLAQGDTLFKQGMASERGQLESQFNDMLRRWGLNRARDLAPDAGTLGYGKGFAAPVSKDKVEVKSKTTTTTTKPNPYKGRLIKARSDGKITKKEWESLSKSQQRTVLKQRKKAKR